MTVDVIAVWLPALALWGLVSLIGRAVRRRGRRTAAPFTSHIAHSAPPTQDPDGRGEFKVLWTAQDDKDLRRLLKNAAP